MTALKFDVEGVEDTHDKPTLYVAVVGIWDEDGEDEGGRGKKTEFLTKPFHVSGTTLGSFLG